MAKSLSRIILVMIVVMTGLAPESYASTFTRHSSDKAALSPPVLLHSDVNSYGTTIKFYVTNPNSGGVVEVFRSTHPTEGFQLVTLSPAPDGGGSIDTNLKPRTTYYYKARVVSGMEISDYSNIFSATTNSIFYPPELSASVLEDGVNVELTIKDRTYANDGYDIIKKDARYNDEFIIGHIDDLDSGQTYIYIDETGEPGATYTYSLNAPIKDEGFPYYENIASVTIETGEPLFKPSIQTSENSVFFTTLRFHVENLNEESSSEVYRSTNATNGFQLIRTIGLGEEFVDENLKPRTNYYYKARAKRETQLSEFSDVIELTTQSLFFNPELSAVLLPNEGGVQLIVKDHSYSDDSYDILRFDIDEETEELIGSVSLPDSGSTQTYVDANALPDKRYIYSLDANLIDPRFPIQHGVASATINTSYLPPPSLSFSEEPPHTFDCGNEIGLEFVNSDDESITEIYRSRTPDSNFELIYSAVGSGSYQDDSLVSLKTYYYKARAVKGDSISEFTSVISKQSGYGFYLPDFELTLLPDQTVEVKITDHSYLDYSYEIYGWNQEDDQGSFSTTFQLLDSGSTYTFIDAAVLPGETYTYHTNVTLNCDGFPIIGEFVSQPITTGFIEPRTTALVLIDPDTDQEVGAISNYDTIPASARFNIKAVTAAEAQSVVFYLNSVRYGENQEPYALFGDWQGDFRPGRLKPGSYTLSVNAYSDNGAKGTKGSTYTVYFTVIGDNNITFEDNIVNVFPNPVITESSIEVNGEPNSALRIEIADQFGSFQQTVYNGSLNEEGIFVQPLDAAKLKKGIYVVAVSMNEKTYTRRFVVK